MDVNVLDPRVVDWPNRAPVPAAKGIRLNRYVTRALPDSDVVVAVAQEAVLDRHVMARHQIDSVCVGTVRSRADINTFHHHVGRVLENKVEHGAVVQLYIVDVDVVAVGNRQKERGFDATVLFSNLPPLLATPIYCSHPRTVDSKVVAVLEVEKCFVLRPRGGVVGGHDRPLNEELHVDALSAWNTERPYEVPSFRDIDGVVAGERGTEEKRF